MGVLGNREESYKRDLSMQIADFKHLSAGKQHFCVLGDFNCSFADNFYFVQESRDQLLRFFEENHMALVTGKCHDCIGHIVLSDGFVTGMEVHITEWNPGKSLSDHKGMMVEII